MAALDVSSQTPRSTGIRHKNNYTAWLRALVCAYLPVRVPVRCRLRASLRGRPCDNTVAAKEQKLRKKPPVERRAGEHSEKRATCRRPATKSPFKRTFCEVNVGRATADHKWKAHAPQTAVNERSSMTSAQTTPTQGSDHCARQTEQWPSRHRHTSLGVAPPTCPTYP